MSINSIFESIKSEKVMTLDHWRYRLLHWTFGQDNPNFLYTHYCPLFHLTNLLVVFFPLVILVKCGVFCGKLLFDIVEFLSDFLPESKIGEDHLITLMKRYIEKSLSFGSLYHFSYEFDSLMSKIAHREKYTKEYCIELWNKIKNEFEQEREQADKEKQKQREKMIWYANFSAVFFKGFLNIFYVLIAFISGFIFTYYVIPNIFYATIYTFKWLLSINPISIIYIIAKITTLVTIIVIPITLIIYLLKIYKDKIHFPVIPGLRAFKDGVYSLFIYLGQLISNIAEFVRMFYEENCPPIKIEEKK